MLNYFKVGRKEDLGIQTLYFNVYQEYKGFFFVILQIS